MEKNITVIPETLPEKIENSSHIETDYDTARDNLRELVSKGSDALDGILELAQESEHPRAYEVVGQIIKTLADTNKDLIELHKSVKEVKKETANGPKNVTNALFVGSTHDLQKLLKGKLENDE